MAKSQPTELPPPPLIAKPTAKFKQDVKRQKKRGKDLTKLRTIIEALCNRGLLDPKHEDHPLGGNWKGWRDRDVEPDWVLIYKEDSGTLRLGRTGTCNRTERLDMDGKMGKINVGKNFPVYCGYRFTMRDVIVASSELVEAVPPSDEDSRLALETCKQLEPFIRAHRESQTHGFHMQICHDDNTVTSIIPGVVLPILLDVLTQIAQGTSVVVNHLPVTLTIEQAADFLNVSTSYVESLVSHHEIPIRVVGKHRQILRADLVTYKKQSDAKRQAVLDELSALGQEIGEGL